MAALVFGFIAITTVVAPGTLLVLALANVVIVFLVSAGQIIISVFPKYRTGRRDVAEEPVVSIIVPTYNEPPEIIMQTLEALSRIEYSNFEIIVIDNNTQDPDVWSPIERYAARLGRKLRFIHVEDLSGFKAGALNFALDRVLVESEYIAVVDADYIVEPDFLTVAVSRFTSREVALVQFPQAYRNIDSSNLPVADEYAHFFKIFMNMANHLNCVPSTGTLSVYRISSLRAVGGFSPDALTEDADVGIRLRLAGFGGVYIDRIVGRGFMPYDLASYCKQKHRWSFGNAQSIPGLLSKFDSIPTTSLLGFLSHLTAWHHFLLIPYAIMAGFVFVATLPFPISEAHETLMTLAVAAFYATLVGKFVLIVSSLFAAKNWVVRSAKAYVVHMGLSFLYSAAPVEFILGKRFRFERTNKFFRDNISDLLRETKRESLLGSWFLLGALFTWLAGLSPAYIVGYVCAALCLLSIHYIYWCFKSTRDVSQTLVQGVFHRHRNDFIPGRVRENAGVGSH